MSDMKGISRRQFLGTGVAAGSAVLLAAQGAHAAEAKAGNDIRVGFIGIGGRGSGVLNAINKSAGVRVTALCDLNDANLDRAAKAVAEDKPELFKDYKKLIEFKDLDAIFIATPCNLHAQMAVDVLNSGRHCYCEKPMAITMKELNMVYAATQKAKGIFQIGTQLRYGSPWKPSIDAINAGKFGKPILIRAYRSNAGDFPRNGWFEDPVQSGDVMLEQAVHEFDIFNAVFGNIAPKRAAAFGGQAMRASKAPMHDFFTLSLDYGDNKAVGYTHSWIAVPNIGCDGMNEFVYCENGAVDIHGGNMYHRESDIVVKPAEGDKPAQKTNKELVSPDPKGDTTQLAVDDFFHCCRSNSRPMANADTGRNAVLVGLMCRKALATGRVIEVEEILAEG